jgi:hypothetical protein
VGQSDRPDRAIPTLLRYDTDDFFNGKGYTGPIEDHPAAEQTAELRTGDLDAARS